MDLALIPPFKLLEDTSITYTQMVLPHLLRYPDYKAVYSQLCGSSFDHVIMDNGAAESQVVEDEDLIEAATALGVDELVVPDVMGDATLSVNRSRDFIAKVKSLSPDLPLGVVVQGTDLVDAVWCLAELLNTDVKIKTVYIPRLLVRAKHHDIRIQLASHVKEQESNVDVHFLGASPLWCSEVLEAARSGLVRSIDTSLPYMYGKKKMYIRENCIPLTQRGSDMDYFTREWSPEEVIVTRYNVSVYLDWSRGIS